MRALITNDDGVDSAGLHALARAAESTGLDVVVAAPSWDTSGASASLTAVEDAGRVLIDTAEIDGVAGAVLAVEASPAFIVRAGLRGAFSPPPDLVLSGVNRGLNVGHAVLHSGTVGAASTASVHGIPALAFSVAGHDDAHWDTVTGVVEKVLSWLPDESGDLLLNVNIPDVAPVDLRGVRAAPLAARGAVVMSVTDVGQGYVTLEEEEPGPAEPGTDAALVEEGYATVSALRSTCEDARRASFLERHLLTEQSP